MVKCPRCGNTEHNFKHSEIIAWRMSVQNEDGNWTTQDGLKDVKETGKVKYECSNIRCEHNWSE
jgi:hypothetical protein